MATNLRIVSRPLSDYVQPILAGRPYSFTRWGDGEWKAVLGHGGRNVDGHNYYPDMGQALKAVLEKNPPYRMGLQPFALKLQPLGDRIRWSAKKWKLRKTWDNADVFHKASIRRCLQPLIEALSQKPVLLVGPPHLKRLKLFQFKFVSVARNNCWQQFEDLLQRTRKAIRKQPEGTVVSVSAGMPAEVLIDRLYSEFGDKHFLIDFGSLWDVYVGVKSRSYHKGLKL